MAIESGFYSNHLDQGKFFERQYFLKPPQTEILKPPLTLTEPVISHRLSFGNLNLDLVRGRKERSGSLQTGDGTRVVVIEGERARIIVHETTDALSPFHSGNWQQACEVCAPEMKAIQANHEDLPEIAWQYPDVAFQTLSECFDNSAELAEFSRLANIRAAIAMMDEKDEVWGGKRNWAKKALLFGHPGSDLETASRDILLYYLHQRNLHRQQILAPLCDRANNSEIGDLLALGWNLNAIFSLSVFFCPKEELVSGQNIVAVSSCSSLADIGNSVYCRYLDRDSYWLEMIKHTFATDANAPVDRAIGHIKQLIPQFSQELYEAICQEFPGLNREQLFNAILKIVSARINKITVELLGLKPMGIYGAFTDPKDTLRQYSLCQAFDYSMSLPPRAAQLTSI